MNRQDIYDLIKKHRDGTATDAEKQTLTNWYNQVAGQESEFPDNEHDVQEKILSRLLKEIDFSKQRTFNYRKWAVAASVLIMLTAGAIFFINKQRERKSPSLAFKQRAIKPGGNKAILVLDNGTQVLLTDAANGQIAQQNGSKIIKTADGKLMYNAAAGTANDTKPQYNTMETPKGGQYQLSLPDGTRVWLNAESSLLYPVDFAAAAERRVELKGEAYFEVAHNPKQPFRVVTDKQTVEVLGTHFNINAYPDERSIKTTLLEGAVSITAGEQKTKLKPGQEANLTDAFKVSEVDPRDAIDWKNGYFRFDDQDMETIMRQIARWYDVKVVFEDESIKKESLVAVTTRFANISTLLKKMEQATNARFIIESNTIRVTKK